MGYDAEKTTQYAKCRLCTIDPTKYVNLVIEDKTGGRIQSNTTLNVGGDVEWLRDELNKLYPPPKAEPEPSEYTVQPIPVAGEWLVSQVVTVKGERTVTVARCASEGQAKKIAQSLNEAEGL